MLSTRAAIRVTRRAYFSSKGKADKWAESAKSKPSVDVASSAGGSSAPTTASEGPSGLLFVGLGVLGIIGVTASNPDSVRSNLNKLGAGNAFEPFIANVERATASLSKGSPPPPVEQKTEKTTAEVKTNQDTATPAASIQKEETKGSQNSSNTSSTVIASKKDENAQKAQKADEVSSPAPETNTNTQKQSETPKDSKTVEKKIVPNNDSSSKISPTIGAVLVADLLGDLESLTREELLYRLNNLTSDMKEHTQWEALRQHDVWRRAEMSTWNKYSELVQEQRDELIVKHETEVAKASAALEAEMSAALNARELAIAAADAKSLELEVKRIEEYYEAMKEAKENEIQADYLEKLSEKRAEAAKERLQSTNNRLQTMEKMLSQIEALKSGFKVQHNLKGEGLEVHRQAAQILMGYSSSTAPLVPQLQRDFNYAFSAGIKASMVPSSLENTAFGHMIGTVLGTVLLIAPEVTTNSDMTGDVTTHIFVSAKDAVQKGDIKSALESLKGLEGPARLAVSDWMKDAQQRVESDEALAQLAK